MGENNKYSKFVEAINKEAQMQQQALSKELDNYCNSELEKAKVIAQKQSDELVKRSLSKAKEDIGFELSSRELEDKKGLFVRRKEITEEVFSSTADKLKEFAKSDDYEQFLVNSFKIILNTLNNPNSLEVMLKESDINTFKNTLAKQTELPCEFKGDSSIRIGGLKVKSQSILIDDTLDSRLENQHEWFYEFSGLTIY